jgi:hypothetical protein
MSRLIQYRVWVSNVLSELDEVTLTLYDGDLFLLEQMRIPNAVSMCYVLDQLKSQCNSKPLLTSIHRKQT